jgi:hypothetical protein
MVMRLVIPIAVGVVVGRAIGAVFPISTGTGESIRKEHTGEVIDYRKSHIHSTTGYREVSILVKTVPACYGIMQMVRDISNPTISGDMETNLAIHPRT